MHHELQCLDAFLAWLRAVGQHPQLRIDRTDHAVAVWAVARWLVITAQVGQIEIVPGAGEAPVFLAAYGVSPVGDAGQSRLGFVLQQVLYLRVHRVRKSTRL